MGRQAAEPAGWNDYEPLTNTQFARRLNMLPLAALTSSGDQGARQARRPWLSVGLFLAMLAVSAVPIFRYLASSEEAAPIAQASPGLVPDERDIEVAPVLSPEQRARREERRAQQELEAQQQAIITLVVEATRALESGDTARAEKLFGQVIELDENNPRAAFGLAQIRLWQGNLSGAEGWIQRAIRKRPKRAAYHTFYADLLMRMGNQGEAREEQLRARGEDEGD